MDLITEQLLKEHSFEPGTLYENCLLFGGEGSVLNEMNLQESSDHGSNVLKFRGKFQEAETINKNKRMYPFSVLDENVIRLKETIGAGGLIGELDHPADSIIHFRDASHKITKLWWDGNTLMGEGMILSTPMGMVLRKLINDGVRVGISSRGVGNGKVNENGILVIGESYKLITFDAVADPSTYAAFQEKVVSTRKESVIPQTDFNNTLKNESESIYTSNQDLLLACLGSIIKKQTRELKARLS